MVEYPEITEKERVDRIRLQIGGSLVVIRQWVWPFFLGHRVYKVVFAGFGFSA